MSDPAKAVFLSYASQDAEAAKRICDALRAAGVEVWFDVEGGLETGDEWDAKIRRQIKECVLFLPIISANTQAREEGYFRIEWELAAQRALGIASGVAFILPIVIDDTREPAALVPDRFRTVQWTRLRDGEMTPEAKAKFVKLWSHRTGVLKHRSSDSQAPLPVPEVSARPANNARVWQVPALTLGLVLAGVAAYFAFKPDRREEQIGQLLKESQAAAAGAQSAEPAPSEARQLVTKARALFVNRLDTTRDDCALAEDLLKQALAKDPAEAEAWAATAHLHAYFLQRGWDNSDTRRESARQAAQRAVRLDARSFEARLATGFLLGDTGAEGVEKERLLRALRGEQPKDQRLLRALAQTLNRLGKFDEANTLLDESAALPGGDPLALYDKSLNFWFAGRTAEAESAIQASLAQRPFTGARLIAAWYAACLHGDLEGARALLGQIPAAEMQEDRAAFFAYHVEKLARQPDAAIARLQVVPREWLDDAWYRGPKARLVGDVLHTARRPAAAAGEWRLALKQVDERLAANPTESGLLIHRAQLLARMGDKEEAARLLDTLSERYNINPAGVVPVWVTNLNAWLGRKQDAIGQISRGLERDRRAVNYSAASLRLDPLFDPLRDEPAFAALIAEAETIEQAAALAARPARDWPKNPELKKAVALLDRLDAIPEDLRLAEEIAQRVLDQASTDPEAVTGMARVQSMWLLRGWDRSSDRLLKAQRITERAVQLAPDEPEALAALGLYLNQRGSDRVRSRQLLERAIELAPAEPRFHRWRNELMWQDQSIPREEVFALVERTVALFPHDALTHYDASRHYRIRGRMEEADRALDAALAIAPVANAMVWKARVEFGLRNNLAGMKQWLDAVPGRVRGIERTVFAYFIYAVMSGDHAVGVNALNDMAEPWMIDFDYRGPKALPLASLLEFQGKPGLARIQYEIALKELRQRQAAEPDDLFLKMDEAWTLHGLGRDEEARAAVRIYIESIERPYRLERLNSWWFHPIACNLVLGERETALTLIREAAETLAGRETVRRFMAIDPRLKQFRDDPEIRALLAEPAGKP